MIRPLGVGIVYWPALHALCEAAGSAIDILEIEPQTLWRPSLVGEVPYRVDSAAVARIQALPQSKLIHGVGSPVGGSLSADSGHLQLLRTMVEAFAAPWASEHLSFNRFQHEGTTSFAGFLLPPRQTVETMGIAAQNVERMADGLGVPVAFETGVNYLRADADELPDGEFFAGIAEQANCGILLDLHNLWTNERNGRQSARDAIKSLPRERIWEIHLAGGLERNGYWLDAHSGAIPKEVVELAAEIIPTLPNLGAIVFEILPFHVARFGLDKVAKEVSVLRRLWRLRKSDVVVISQSGHWKHSPSSFGENGESVLKSWEAMLGRLVRGETAWDEPSRLLADDPGTAVLHELAFEARSGQIVDSLRLTSTLLLLVKGATFFRQLMHDYAHSIAPEMFNALEADHFATYLMKQALDVPYLQEVLSFEHALIQATVYGASTEVAFTHDPGELLDALDRGCMPENVRKESVTVAVCGGSR